MDLPFTDLDPQNTDSDLALRQKTLAAIRDAPFINGHRVNVPFREGHFSVSGASWASGNLTGGGDNDDGSTTFLQFAMATTLPAPTPNYIRHLFYGTSYGIRFNPTFTSGGGGVYDFCVIIDRVAYRVKKARYYDDTLAAWDISGNGAHHVTIARNLADGPHYAEINITPQAAVNGQIIFGFSADAKYYRQYTPRGFFNAPVTLTTGFVAINLGTNNYYRGLGLRGILYYNSDTVPRTSEVQFNAATIWKKTIAAGDTVLFDPTTLVGISGTAAITHKADANSVVQSTVITGN
jgi:hypothetical protein